MNKIKNKMKQQIFEQVQMGQIVNYNGKQYKVVHIYTQPTDDPELEYTIPTDPTKFPVYVLQNTTNPNEISVVTKQGQVQFGG